MDVKKAWGDAPVSAPAGGVFVEVAPLPGGGVLAATGGSVLAAGPGGALAPLASGDQAVLNLGGDTFGIRQGNTFRIHDASGALLGTLPGVQPFESFQLVPGGSLAVAPRVRVVEESGVVESVRLLQPDGSLTADFPAAGLQISRLASDRIVYTLPSALIARRAQGRIEFVSYGLVSHLRLLPTPPHGDAVSFGYRPENVCLKRTYTSLNKCAYGRTERRRLAGISNQWAEGPAFLGGSGRRGGDSVGLGSPPRALQCQPQCSAQAAMRRSAAGIVRPLLRASRARSRAKAQTSGVVGTVSSSSSISRSNLCSLAARAPFHSSRRT